jgi:hypothetical protein
MTMLLLACGQTERDTDGANTAGSGGSSGGSAGSAAGSSEVTTSSGGTTTSSGGASSSASTTSGEPEAYPIPDHCNAGEPIDSAGGCELPVACDEVTVVATCQDNGRCRCDVDGPDYWLQETPPEERCLAASSVCLAPAEFTEWQCAALSGEMAPGLYCTALAECERTATVNEDVSFTQRQVHSAGCNAREAGTWECDCILPDRSEVRFSIDGDPACPNVLDACIHDRFERQGPRRCALVSSDEDEHGCGVLRECSRDASFDGASITLREQLLVSCGSLGQGQWECDCPAGRGSLDIQHDDPAQACQIAEATCLTEEEMEE